MKFYKFLITAACIAIAAVCIALIVRVNRAFPNAEEVSYTKDNPADLDGLEITPVNAKVYTLEDYSAVQTLTKQSKVVLPFRQSCSMI